ncbi:synergin gamma-like [Ptychodera flava]|uniref:synergin gamma-like n=1 Tax=Ptychodera flava TaxID=63121 RepID=UPI00396AA660
MAGGFFDSDRTEETADSETKEPTKKSDTNTKFVPRRISSYDDEDDLFGRKPPAMTDFDDDEFGDFDSAPPISHDIDDDLFTSAIKPKPKPEKSFDMFGGQKFKGKANPVQSVQEQESEKSSDINTADNVSSKTCWASEANPPAIENLEFNKSEETSDKYGVFKGLTEQKPATAALEDKYNIFRELEQSSEKLPEDKNMFGEVRPGKSTTPEIEIQENKGLIKGDNSLPTQSRNNLDNRTKKEKDLFSSGSRYQIGGDDDLFGNLGPNPPGYSPPGNISNDNFSDFSSSVASKTPDSISINSKESDSSGFDGSGIKKGLPKLESFASLDLKSFDTTPSGDDEDAGDSYGYTAPTDSTTNTIDSQPTKALDKRSGALVISTGPPPVPSISTGPPLPLFGDRYGGVVGDIEDNERHTYEWQRCLQSCYNTLRKANETFNAVSSSSVCTEVISSEEGSSYLQALIEIYRVSCRVGTAMKASGLETDELLDLLRNTNLLWNNLAAFLAGSPLMPDDSLFVFSGAVLKADPSNADRACGVCLLNVDSRSKAFDRSVDSHKLTYGGRQYHSMCANLWVNLVDSILPALPLPSLLL